jgi:hypothetical protein
VTYAIAEKAGCTTNTRKDTTTPRSSNPEPGEHA